MTPPGALAQEAMALGDDAANLDDSQRAKFLTAQLDGLAATAERLAGKTVPYKEEVRRCYGIRIERTDEAEFAEAHEALDRVIPGAGPLRDRYHAWLHATEIPMNAVLDVVPALKGALHRRTVELFGLPDGELAEVELTSNQPWQGFNYYLGGLRSRVVINTDIPTRADFLVMLLAHEIYPGHHTEHSWKEDLLVRGRAQLEESIFLIATPQCLVAEGIASYALEALGPEAESTCAALLADAGHAYDLELSRAVRDIQHALAATLKNAALMLHEEGADRDAAMRYLRRWSVETDERLEQSLDFLIHPVWRAYNPIYEAGYRAVAAWTNGEPARFRRLLTEQLTASDLTAPTEM
ncbi:MAG TPA: DUF885 domain-containing protein [Candidatus Dormibacteraeota bacterium]|nr:DUF885 domain-containing protein [Candidatus Dormibacteraeota bacterium]